MMIILHRQVLEGKLRYHGLCRCFARNGWCIETCIVTIHDQTPDGNGGWCYTDQKAIPSLSDEELDDLIFHVPTSDKDKGTAPIDRLPSNKADSNLGLYARPDGKPDQPLYTNSLWLCMDELQLHQSQSALVWASVRSKGLFSFNRRAEKNNCCQRTSIKAS